MTDDFLSEEEKQLFRAQMRCVTPLKQNNKINSTPSQPKEAGVRLTKKVPPQTPISPALFLSDYISDPVLSNSILSYRHSSIPNQRFRALKNGAIPWEAKLYLHGLKTEAARTALTQFIQNQVQAQRRCLLIIHGKGGHEGAHPVIKNLVNRWLPQFEEVLAFHSALPKDGSFGALYVLLKK